MSNKIENIVDIDLSAIKKKKFRINNDDSKIIELNTSDLTIISRISDIMPKLKALQERASNIADGLDSAEDGADTLKTSKTMAERLTVIDSEMRQLVDDIFQAPISEITASDGSMYDLFGGTFRYDYIISTFIKQYEENLQKEFKLVDEQMKQVKKHTDKYIKKSKK